MLGTSSNFYIQLKLQGKTIIVRLLPATDSQKTPAVKEVTALVASFVRAVYPESRYRKTNLQEYSTTRDLCEREDPVSMDRNVLKIGRTLLRRARTRPWQDSEGFHRK